MNPTRTLSEWSSKASKSRPEPASTGASAERAIARRGLVARGNVQGVGFRPFVYRLAAELGLSGSVQNTGPGVRIEIQGPAVDLDAFARRLVAELPSPGCVTSLEASEMSSSTELGFSIRESDATAPSTPIVPDLATCPACLQELVDPANRRFGYPFVTCALCGPRFSVVEALPYDRERTSMRDFTMCPECRAEYESPADRRFHAQTVACPACGPRLRWCDPAGRELARGGDPIALAADAVAAGAVVAIKGVGGFHLLVDAGNDVAVGRLRARKRRPDKPFALMAPSLDVARELCSIDDVEARSLGSPAAPIVLLARRSGAPVSDAVAPANPFLGVMLPYAPVQHLLLRRLGRAVVATSGNLSDEPLCTDDDEARARLGEIADFFLLHDRRILRPLDDSIVRVVLGRELVLRRARGYAPTPVCRLDGAERTLASGAHMKNTVALAVEGQVVLGPHVGDLDDAIGRAQHRRVRDDLVAIYAREIDRVAADAHPDYGSTLEAERLGKPLASVQHHLAHVVACMADNRLSAPCLGIAWDGTGLGTDGTIWGGEFLAVDGGEARRVAHLLPFPLPGGDAAARDPRRSALGALFRTCGEHAFDLVDVPALRAMTDAERARLSALLLRDVQCPRTSSAGRLFDAVSSILGLCERATFEGQAAMALEFAAGSERAEPWDLPVERTAANGPWIVDWRPMLVQLVNALRSGVAPRVLAARVHATLGAVTADVALRVGLERVVLTGGCFQNRRLLETCVLALERYGFIPYWHRQVPPNDGGVALGQLVAAARGVELRNES